MLSSAGYRWSSLRRARETETRGATRERAQDRSVRLASGIFIVIENRMSFWQFLCAVARNFEDVDTTSVSCCLELLVEACQLVLPLDRDKDRLRHDRLGIPVRQSTHNGCCFFVAVNCSSIKFILIFQRRIGIDGGLCTVTAG